MNQHILADSPVSQMLPANVGIVVHSHLRWDFVWQRPQQLLSRLARTNAILFVEEPIASEGRPTLDVTTVMSNVTRVVPRIPRDAAETPDAESSITRGLVRALLESPSIAPRFARIVQWFYTPMPAPTMIGAFNEEAVVYDCMDELAQFRFAPSDITQRERFLLSHSAVVFTGGHRLFEAKSRHHDNVHFFGCGVDIAHFAAALDAAVPMPDDLTALGRPILGYIGVIDERLDYELIGGIARARPEWTIAMIGPLAKVEAAELPREPNIAWLGSRSYDELPRYLKGFDVCLMPFALNAATEYINPTKTLEYLAAGRPVVSTPVADVVHNFGSLVDVAGDVDGFVAAAARAIEHPDPVRRQAGLDRASTASWDAIVRSMRTIIGESLEANTSRVREPRAWEDPMQRRRSRSAAPRLAAAGRDASSEAVRDAEQ